MEVKVLGTGCCQGTNSTVDRTASLIADVARERGIDVVVSTVHDIRAMAACGVMSSPAVVIDGEVVHAGGQPSRERVGEWLASSATKAVPAVR